MALLQIDCRSIYNKILDFWNSIETYNPHIVLGTESWLSDEISNAEILGPITQLSEDKDILAVVKCSFV